MCQLTVCVRRAAIGLLLDRGVVALLPRPDGTAPRILIAEDNDINALLARRVSERAGCVVEVVGNGRAAIAAVEQSIAPGGLPFDLILMDVFMPELDGLAATARDQAAVLPSADGALPACPPIIALTANAFPEDRERCLAAGMDDYLAKPFDGRQLTAVVGRWVPAIARRNRPHRSAVLCGRSASSPSLQKRHGIVLIETPKTGTVDTDGDSMMRQMLAMRGAAKSKLPAGPHGFANC